MSIGLWTAAGAADSNVWAGAALPGEKICLCLPKICLGLEEPSGGSDIKSRSKHSKEKGATNLGGYVGVKSPWPQPPAALLLGYKRLVQFCCRRSCTGL